MEKYEHLLVDSNILSGLIAAAWFLFRMTKCIGRTRSTKAIASKHLHVLSQWISSVCVFFFWVCSCTNSFVCQVEKRKYFQSVITEGSWWRHRSLSSCVTRMPTYTVTVATGSQWFAGTDDYIYLTLVGTEGCSERTLLDKPLYNDFERGAVRCHCDSFQFLNSDCGKTLNVDFGEGANIILHQKSKEEEYLSQDENRLSKRHNKDIAILKDPCKWIDKVNNVKQTQWTRWKKKQKKRWMQKCHALSMTVQKEESLCLKKKTTTQTITKLSPFTVKLVFSWITM